MNLKTRGRSEILESPTRWNQKSFCLIFESCVSKMIERFCSKKLRQIKNIFCSLLKLKSLEASFCRKLLKVAKNVPEIFWRNFRFCILAIWSRMTRQFSDLVSFLTSFSILKIQFSSKSTLSCKKKRFCKYCYRQQNVCST